MHINYCLIIGMHIQHSICEIPKYCGKFHAMHFYLQAEVSAGGI